MDTTFPFLKIISVIADFITIAGVITAIRFAILKKNENLFAFRISVFLQYLVRTALIIIFIAILFQWSDFLYGLLLALFKGQWGDDYYWEQGKEIQHLLAYFVTSAFGLSFLWIVCTLIWTSSFNLTKEFINLFLPQNKILLKQTPLLEISNATYGTEQNKIDVTQTLRQMIKNNKLTIKASNEIGGDPQYGVAKTLTINYKIGQKSVQATVFEGATVTIPDGIN